MDFPSVPDGGAEAGEDGGDEEGLQSAGKLGFVEFHDVFGFHAVRSQKGAQWRDSIRDLGSFDYDIVFISSAFAVVIAAVGADAVEEVGFIGYTIDGLFA